MKFKKPHINWTAVFYTIFLLGSIVGIVMLMNVVQVKSSEYACQDLKIIVRGEDSFVDQQNIEKLIIQNHGTLVGRTLETLPIHQIEKDLEQIPYVKNVTVSMDINGLLKITIDQRKPVLRIINELGNGYYLDEDGLKMPYSLQYVPKVPVANGKIKEDLVSVLDTIQTVQLQDLFDIAKYVHHDSVWSYQITQLYVNSNDEIELVPRMGNQKIVIGNGQDLEKKFEKLLIFYDVILPRAGVETYKSVYLNYEGQLVCERNPGIHPDSLRMKLQVN